MDFSDYNFFNYFSLIFFKLAGELGEKASLIKAMTEG